MRVKTTQKNLKELIKNNIAIDITSIRGNELNKIGFFNRNYLVKKISIGIYGINGALIELDNKLYVISKRCSNLFALV
ncbi:hypothetical protein [Campylobacter sp. RM12651]|uniref:hypothetical protein n=1 Tax=Campylobacter sp. RM12651 TaxID=1660079 RepID=UPI001EFAAC18|nr:hypothetical protein [Campylobacter sp. RM12651]ULO04592.1 hypothetical protein AVBRAN_a0110 [Campylobacter sp. RM12651]